MLVIEESIKFAIFQISNKYATLETLNSDSHEGLLMNPFSEREMHVHSDSKDARLQIEHHKLQESGEKEEVVLETFSDDDLTLGS